MSTPRMLAAGLLLLAALGAPGAAAPPDETTGAAPPADPRVLTYADLTISFPEPTTFTLSNGLTVHMFRDSELPIVDLAFYMKAGSIYDPPDRVGLASLATHLMRTGGTRDLSPDEVDEELEFLPATASFSAASDAVSGRLSALEAQFPRALKIFAAMLRLPRFDAARLEVAKSRVLEQIRRRWDDPGTIAALNFSLLVYGADSPWARLETAATIGRITREDLLAFHRDFVRPGNLVMGVAGDFEPRAMKKLLRTTFGSWKGSPVALRPVPKIETAVPAGVHLIERPLTQSSLAIGHLGVTRFDPDKFPLKILNYILGEGGFASRLMKEVRSTRGLAYSIGGGVGIDSDRGLFGIYGRTKSESTVEAIDVIRDVVTGLRTEGPTPEEMRQAKEASINSFVFSVEGTVGYMLSYLYYLHYDYPPDYLATYRDNLAHVTREQVVRAARKHIDPDHLVIVVVGNPQEFDRPLESLGLGEPRVITLDEERPALRKAG